MFSGLDHPTGTLFPESPLAGTVPNLFLLKAFTRTYAMAGLSFGLWDLLQFRSASGCPELWAAIGAVSSVAQAAGICALQDSDYLPQSRRLIQIEREFLKEQLHTQNLLFLEFPSQFPILSGMAKPGSTTTTATVLQSVPAITIADWTIPTIGLPCDSQRRKSKADSGHQADWRKPCVKLPISRRKPS